jgi:uncharacterized membrane protein YbhN (UPF0104 family)
MKISRLQFTLFSLVVSLISFGYLFSKIDVAEVRSVIYNAIPSWLVIFVIFSLSMSIFRTWRYQVLLLASGYCTATTAVFLITLVRNFFSDLLPARLGTLVYIYLVRTRLHIPLPPALASFSYAFVFDILSLSLLIIPALAFIRISPESTAAVSIAGLVLLAASAAVVHFLPGLSHGASLICNSLIFLPEKWRLRLRDGLVATEQHLAMVQSGGVYWKVILLSFGVRICKYGSLYALLLGLVIPLGYTVSEFPAAKVFLGLTSAEMASSLPISGIAGFGAYEGTWALVFQLLGYSERTALLTGISHHLVTQLYGYGLGVLALLTLLLPVFSRPGKAARQVPEGRGFWIKLAVLIIFLTLSLSINIKTYSGSSNFLQEKSASSQPADMPAAKLVFEGPGGIYLLQHPGGKPERILSDGSWPRWSPDGRFVVFIRDNSILLYDHSQKKTKVIARADSARAVCFTDYGRAVLFTDGLSVRRVDLETLETGYVLSAEKFLEIDSSDDGRVIAATVKTTLGFKVRVYRYPALEGRDVARGCSASLSPDGSFVTVNSLDHKTLRVYSSTSLKLKYRIAAPSGKKFDNQSWSNHPLWLSSISEGRENDIHAHNLRSKTELQMTLAGHYDRADIFILGKRDMVDR